MHQFECRNCGYDMTGIEKFTNTLSAAALYSGYGQSLPLSMDGIYENCIGSSTITCPNCGKTGQWIKH